MKQGDKLRCGVCEACLLNCVDIIIGISQDSFFTRRRFLCTILMCVWKNRVQWEIWTSVSLPHYAQKGAENRWLGYKESARADWISKKKKKKRYNVQSTWQFLMLPYSCILHSLHLNTFCLLLLCSPNKGKENQLPAGVTVAPQLVEVKCFLKKIQEQKPEGSMNAIAKEYLTWNAHLWTPFLLFLLFPAILLFK